MKYQKIKMLSKTTLVLLLFLVTAFLLHFWYGLSSDEGVVLNGAWNMYNGRVLYQDFFEYAAPGSFYLVYSIIVLFGPSYIFVKIFSVLLLSLCTWFIYKIYLLLHKNKTAGIITALVFFIITSAAYPLINHNTYSLFLTIILSFFFLKFLREKKVIYIFFCGLLAGLVFYFLQNKGFLIIVWLGLSLIYLFIKNKVSLNHIFWCLLGIIPVFLTGIILWSSIVFRAPFQISSIYYEVNKISFLFFGLSLSIWLGVFLLFKFNHWFNDKFYWLFGLQLVLFVSTLNLPDIYHLLLNSFPLIILLSILITKKYINCQKYFNNKLTKTFFFLILVIIYATLFIKFTDRLETTTTTKNMLENINKITQFESVFAHPFLPGMYFELNKYNPYYTNVIETIQGDSFFLEKNYQILVNQKPGYVITNYKIAERFDYQYNVIDNYIQKNYQLVKKYNNTWLWQIIE